MKQVLHGRGLFLVHWHKLGLCEGGDITESSIFFESRSPRSLCFCSVTLEMCDFCGRQNIHCHVVAFGGCLRTRVHVIAMIYCIL